MKWIDIQERQPEAGQMVLFFSVEYYEDNHQYIMSGKFDRVSGYSRRGVFQSIEGTMIGSHWLPLDVLPPLPGSEGKG